MKLDINKLNELYYQIDNYNELLKHCKEDEVYEHIFARRNKLTNTLVMLTNKYYRKKFPRDNVETRLTTTLGTGKIVTVVKRNNKVLWTYETIFNRWEL